MNRTRIIGILIVSIIIVIAAYYAVDFYNEQKILKNYHPAVIEIGRTFSPEADEEYVLFDNEDFQIFNARTARDAIDDYANWIESGKPDRWPPKNFNWLLDSIDHRNERIVYVFGPESVIGKGKKDYLVLDMQSYVEFHGDSVREALYRYLSWAENGKKYPPETKYIRQPQLLSIDDDFTDTPELSFRKINNQTLIYWEQHRGYHYRNRAGTIREFVVIDTESSKEFHGISHTDLVIKLYDWKISQNNRSE
ncbi:MAG: hypothetical protein WC788_05440 [Candidatus Paceibacterota bacterium]|jgi:hypothetical protein